MGRVILAHWLGAGTARPTVRDAAIRGLLRESPSSPPRANSYYVLRPTNSPCFQQFALYQKNGGLQRAKVKPFFKWRN